MRTEEIDGKKITILPAEVPTDVAVFLNGVNDDYAGVIDECSRLGCRSFSLALVSGLDWNADLTTWPAESVVTKDDNFLGNAERHLHWMEEKVMPLCPAEHNILAGYSLAGLFALYAPFLSDRFEALACGSASVWYPDFEDFVLGNVMRRKPKAIYLSIGDRESDSRIPALQETIAITQRLSFFYRGLGIPTKYELNPGGHFADCERRMAKAITHCVNTFNN